MRIIADYIKKYWWLLLILLAAAILFIFLGKRVPSWVEWKEKTVTLANDCMLVLKDKRVYLKDVNGNYLWKSTDMMVQDAFVCDIDRSGDEELILLTWKKGKYGKDMPFWEKEKEIMVINNNGIVKQTEKKTMKEIDEAQEFRILYVAT